MTITEELVREQLKQVIDPELFINIVDLGLVYTVEILPAEAAAATDESAGGDDPSESPESDNSGAAPAAETSAAGEAPAGAESGDAAGAEENAAPQDAAEVDGAEGDGAAAEAGVEGPVQVKIDMTMTSPMCPAGPQLVANSKQAVSQLPGVEQVEVRVVMDPPWTPDLMTDDAKDKLGIF